MRGRVGFGVMLCTLAWLLAGCAGEEQRPAAPTELAPPSRVARLVGVQLGALRTLDGGATAPGREDRFALLLGATPSAAGDPAFVEQNLALVEGVLESVCHVPPAAQRRLSGAEFTPEAVATALEAVAQRATSDDSLLLVYLSGLAVVDAQGVEHCLTPASRRQLDGRWQGTIERQALTDGLQRLVERAAGAGRRLHTVFVTDLARPPGSSPVPGQSFPPGPGWELHAHRNGRLPEAPANASPTAFTRAFVGSLQSLAEEARAAPVELVFERSERTVLTATGGRQQPAIVRPDRAAGEPPRLVASRRLTASVRVLDALSGLPVPGAELSVDGRVANHAEARAAQPAADGTSAAPLLLEALPGRHLLRVSGPDYLTRVEEFELDVEHAGRVVEVSLLPALVHVQGWVSPPRALQVRVDGAVGTGHEGYHVLAASSDANGRFELRLPRLAAGQEVVVSDQGRELLRRGLPLEPERFLGAPDDIIEGLGVVDLGPLLVPDGRELPALRAEDLALVQAGGAGALPLPGSYENPRSLPAPVFLAEADTARWQLFLSMTDRGEWLPALAQLEALSLQMDDQVYEAWRGWLEVHHAEELLEVTRIEQRRASLPADPPNLRLSLASLILSRHLQRAQARAVAGELQAVELLQAMPLDLLAGDGTYARTLATAVEARRRGVAATLLLALAQRQRWPQMLDVCEALGTEGDWGSPAFGALRREALATALERELDRALFEGLGAQDWQRADQRIDWMTQQGERLGLVGTPALLELAERIGVERVPAEVRRLQREAGQAFLAGDLLGASGRYAQLDGRVRGVYADFVAEQQQRLAAQLYVRFVKEAEEAELERRVPEAASAYARALRYDRRAAGELLRLGVQTPGVVLVTADGRSGRAEIGPALAGSPDDLVLLVGPGVYAEALVLGGRRTLLGVGGEVLVVAPAGSALSVPAGSSVGVAGISFASEAAGVATVRIDEAEARLESCRLLPALGGPALAVTGVQARAELRRCEIPGADGDGLRVADEARLDLVGCSVGLPGSGDGELRRYLVAEAPRHVRVTDSVFGRYLVGGSERLTQATLAAIQLGNTLRVQADPASWPNWAVAGLTHCASLGEALAVAEPGATVLAAPGVYHESLRPTRAVRLLAEIPGSVVVDGGQSESALHLEADVAVVVQGITFRLHRPEGVGRSETVVVRRGHLDLSDCLIEAFDSTDAWQPEGLAVGAPAVPPRQPDADDAFGATSPSAGTPPALATASPSPGGPATGEGTPAAGAAVPPGADLAAVASVVLRRCRIASDAVGITVRGAHSVSVWDSEIVGRLTGVRPDVGGRAELVATTIRGCERGVRLGGPGSSAALEACTLADNAEPFAFDGGAQVHQLRLAGTSVR